MQSELEIIYQDDHFVAINKPNGLLVHRTSIASHETTFALQLVRDQTGQHVYPVHRLDRKTSGVLVFAFSSEIAKQLQAQFSQHQIQKTYAAIVRGYFPNVITVDHALTNDRGKTQEAITHFELMKRTELDIPLGSHPTSRYSLIQAYPKTGRMHQIRKHCNHLRHPIIGDRPHGCNKQNRLFKERWNMTTMLLHAASLVLVHPFTKERLELLAERPEVFKKMQVILDL